MWSRLQNLFQKTAGISGFNAAVKDERCVCPAVFVFVETHDQSVVVFCLLDGFQHDAVPG